MEKITMEELMSEIDISGWKWSWLGDLESSYRTYEEWKLEFGVGLITGIEEFLPYL